MKYQKKLFICQSEFLSALTFTYSKGSTVIHFQGKQNAANDLSKFFKANQSSDAGNYYNVVLSNMLAKVK